MQGHNGKGVTQKMTVAEFGRELAAARKRKGWSQQELARRLGCKVSRISSAEAGYRQLSVRDIQALEQLLDDPRFTFAIARYTTNGLVGSVAEGLCGVPVAAIMALAIEMRELQQLMERVQPEVLRGPTNDNRELMVRTAVDGLDVNAITNQFTIDVCDRYPGTTLRTLVAMHEQEKREKGYGFKKSDRPLARTA